MAEQHQLLRHQQGQHPTEGIKSMYPSEKGPSVTKILAVVTLLPVGGTLLFLAGITLTGTLIGLAISTPLFLIFSPVLVPAALTIGLAVAGFLTSGAFGITALSSMSWMVNYLRSMRGSSPEQTEHGKRRVHDTAGHIAQKAKEMGQTIQGKAQETGKT